MPDQPPATHLAGIPAVLGPVDFAGRFVPTEYGPDWSTAALATCEEHWDPALHGGQTFEDFTAELARDGIRTPVEVYDGICVVDGHHRVIAALRTGTPIPWAPVDAPGYEGQVPEDADHYFAYARSDVDDDALEAAGLLDSDWWAAVAEQRDANLGTVTVTTAIGRQVTVTPGVIDDDARYAFVAGHCHHLALALHDHTGWPVVGLWPEDLEPGHVGVRTPDGQVLDITGACTPEEWVEAYGGPDSCDYAPLEADDITHLRSGDFGIAGLEHVAASFVEPVLDRWRRGVRA